jgi:hypothetical protein
VTERDWVLGMVDALESLGLRYIVVGAYSVNLYALPRVTKDADILVELTSDAYSRLREAAGDQYQFDDQILLETITGKTRYVARPIDGDYMIDLFEMADDPHDASRMARRRRVEYGGRQMWVPTKEDVLVTKLRWYKRAGRLKDGQDIQNLLDARRHDMDWAYVYEWAERHGTRALLEKMRAAPPPSK